MYNLYLSLKGRQKYNTYPSEIQGDIETNEMLKL